MIRPSSRLAALAVVPLALLAMGPRAVHAAPTKPDPAQVVPLAEDAFVALDSEILALVALGAFGDTPPLELQAVHDEWQEYIVDADRPELIDWAIDADRDGAAALSALRALGVPITPAIERAVGPLTQDDLDALAAGRPIPGDHLLYVRAREQLDQLAVGNVPNPNGEVPVAAPTVPVPVATVAPNATTPPATAAPATAAPATAAPATTATLTEPTERGGSIPTLWLAGALGVAGLGAVALVASLRRGGGRRVRPERAPTAATPLDQFELLAEAARRMTGALDDGEIARIALDQAMQMTGARHGAFVTVDGGGLTATATSGDVFSVRSFTGGLMARVADTGQTIRRVAHDEPAITSLPAAVLAAPVIGGGRVAAIVFLVRPDATPFGPDDEVALERLTPVVASALAAASKHEDATALSLLDPLTGLANRRALDADLASLGGAAPQPAAVVMVDVDHFKLFNDRNGHAAGDEALRAVARALQAGVRPGDRVYRYGGEEFCLLLPSVDRAEAEQVAERVRALVQEIDVPGSSLQPGGALTVSMGVALVPAIAPAPALQLADGALYDAKAGGRNCVVVTQPVG